MGHGCGVYAHFTRELIARAGHFHMSYLAPFKLYLGLFFLFLFLFFLEPGQSKSDHAGSPPVFSFFVLLCGTGTRRDLVTVHGSALGCRPWPVIGDVLFDQLSRGFRQEEVNVHRLSGRTSLGEPIAPCLPVYFRR